MIKKVAVLTSGGDAPGMNNAVRAVVKKAKAKGIDPFLVFNGYKGLYEGDIQPASNYDIDSYISKGGTFIKTARFPEFKKLETRQEAKKQLDEKGIDALIVIGGDGSYQGAQLLHELGVKTIALPGTIDNDITSSDFTIGYDTALNSIVDNVERLKDTAVSHDRTMIVEVMGHGSGDLALFSALATGAHVVVTNENKKTAEEIGNILKEQHTKGKKGLIVIVSEHIFDDLEQVAKTVENVSGVVTRAVILGHTQRGGIPTAFERILSTQMALEAVELLSKDESGLAIGILNNQIKSTPILEALSIPRLNRKKLADEINELNGE